MSLGRWHVDINVLATLDIEAVIKGRRRDREFFCNLVLAACRIRVEKVNCRLNLQLLSWGDGRED
jgi:hypothetical protein